MTNSLPPYTVVIRTLGKAGKKYQVLLDSLKNQTHQPEKILVYLAEGYEKPKESIGIEEIVYVKKGMVAQRALPYKEVDTEWMLFIDDDVAIEPWGVEKMLKDTIEAKADVCAFDAFPHHTVPLKSRLAMMIMLSAIPRFGGKHKGYRVNFWGSYCYNPHPKTDYAWSTTNAGPAFICRKSDFLNLRYEEELWMDRVPYAFPDDQIMFHKMHLRGLKILTHYNSGFKHLDAGTSKISNNDETRARNCQYSAAHNLFIYENLYLLPNLNPFYKSLRFLIKGYINFLTLLRNFLLPHKYFPDEIKKGRKDAILYLKSMNKE